MATISGVFRLGRDAEKFSSENGTFISLSLAYDVYVDGEEKAQWIKATWGGSRAEKLAEHLKRGTAIYATIKDPHLAEFKDRDGNPRQALTGRILDLEFAGGRPAPAPAEKAEA
jgi:Single-stranded DNA-binding protein